MTRRKVYPTDVTNEEWSFAAPYLVLMDERAPQRQHDLREVFNALRWIVRAGAPWRMLPGDFPPWEAVYQQTRRWLQAGCFEAMVNDLRSVIRVAQQRQGQPSAMVLDGRTLQSSCESGSRAGYDGYKRRNGSKVHMAVDTLGQLLAVHVTPANEHRSLSRPCCASTAYSCGGTSATRPWKKPARIHAELTRPAGRTMHRAGGEPAPRWREGRC